MPPADKAAKAKAAAAAKKIEDKTFGMKNKNKCVCLLPPAACEHLAMAERSHQTLQSRPRCALMVLTRLCVCARARHSRRAGPSRCSSKLRR